MILTSIALTFLITLVTGGLKWLVGHIGRTWTQVIVFACALIGATYLQYHTAFPTLDAFITHALVLFSGAVAVYEVLLKYFPLFSGPQD